MGGANGLEEYTSALGEIHEGSWKVATVVATAEGAAPRAIIGQKCDRHGS